MEILDNNLFSFDYSAAKLGFVETVFETCEKLSLLLHKLALLTSFTIVTCKEEPQWFDPRLIEIM